MSSSATKISIHGKRILYSLTALLLWPLYGYSSEYVELAIPLDKAERQALSAADEYEVKEKIFFAERYRLIRIDHAVLRNEKAFALSLFDDRRIVLQRSTLDSVDGTVLDWVGEIVDPALPAERFVRSEDAPGRAEVRRARLHRVMLSGLAFDIDTDSGEAFPATVLRNAKGIDRPADRSKLRAAEWYGFHTEFFVPGYNARYRLENLTGSPDVHVLYRVDQSKLFAVNTENVPELKRRKDNYTRYMESLGPDPRDAWESRHDDVRGDK